MSNNYFQFKQFTVYQDKTAMKVGTDGVLLGALSCRDAKPCRVLDIGTGTGLVALMMAQRFADAQVDAVEIDADAAEQAKGNFSISPFAARLKVVHSDIACYTAEQPYDLIVSNPPYFIDSLKAPDAQRNMARHAVTLDCDTFAKAVNRLLSDEGQCAVVYPADSLEILKDSLVRQGLVAKSVTYVKPNAQKAAKRAVVTFVKGIGGQCGVNEIVMEKERHVYTDEFGELVKEFYLDR